MNGRDKKDMHDGADVNIEKDMMERSQLNKLELLTISFLQTSLLKMKDEILNDNNIKKSDKETIKKLLEFFDNINNQVNEPKLRLQLTQQAIINAYYAIRRTEGRSMLFFKDTSIVGNKLEKIASEDLKIHGSLIVVPHEVNAENSPMNFIGSSHSERNIKNAVVMLKEISTDEKTIHEELLMKMALIDFSSDSSNIKKTKAAELLENYRNILQTKNTKSSNQFADKLQKIFNVNFSSIDRQNESSNTNVSKRPSMKSD